MYRILTVSCGILLSSLLLSGGQTAWAQASASSKRPPAENKSLMTKDGAEIRITYFATKGGKDAPVIVMLHGRAGNRLVWQPLAESFADQGYAVVTVDLRKHGESSGGPGSTTGGAGNAGGKASALKAPEIQAMVAFDMEAVKRFLFDEHQRGALNMTKLGIVASDFSCGVALAFTELDWAKEPYDDAPLLAQRTPRGQDVRALVLISPEAAVPGIAVSQLAAVARNLGVPALVAYGSKDPAEKGASKKLYEQLTGEKAGTATKKTDENAKPGLDRVLLQPYDVKLRGTDLLGRNLRLEAHIQTFMNEYLKKLTLEWRDRRSRIERND